MGKWLRIAVVALTLGSLSFPVQADQADIAARKYSKNKTTAEIDALAQLGRKVTTALQERGYSVTIEDLDYVMDMYVDFVINYGDKLTTRLKPDLTRLFVSRSVGDAGTCYDLGTGFQAQVNSAYYCYN